MNLKKLLFTSLTILSLAVPVTGGAFVLLSADPVFAKGGNGKGGSDRGDRGKRDKDRGGKGSAGKGGSGKGGKGQGGPGKGSSGKGQGAPGASGGGKPAKAATQIPTDSTAPEEVALHPSELGSMNGAMNANINAVLAHIRNGNTNGPVGALAGLAVADHNATGAQDVIDTAAGFETLETALEDAGFESFEDYQAAVDEGEIDPVPTIEDANAALGEAVGDEPPTEEEIAEAEAAIDALSDAEAGIMDAWNKSGAASEEEKAALLAALRERLSGESETIADTIGAGEEDDMAGEEDEADGDTDSDGEIDGEGDGDTLDPEIQAMIDNLKF